MADERQEAHSSAGHGEDLPAEAEVAGGEREAFLQRMAQLYDRMMARLGAEGESFDDIEELALKLGREASQELMSRRLGAEEGRGSQPQLCPRCGHRLRRPEPPAERKLDTCAGTVAYRRRHAICDRCRTSFSPSGPEAQDTGPGGLKPPGAQDM